LVPPVEQHLCMSATRSARIEPASVRLGKDRLLTRQGVPAGHSPQPPAEGWCGESSVAARPGRDRGSHEQHAEKVDGRDDRDD
jgi:hypothetical protein